MPLVPLNTFTTMNNKRRLTDFDSEYPREMLIYMRHNGPHFNRRLCEFAVSLMTKEQNGQEVPIKPFTKDEVDNLLKAHSVKLKNNQLYDYVYVANMCKADFLGSSVPDEHYLALYIKDVIDDIDAQDGFVFNRWYADMCYSGYPIDWEDVL